MPDGFDAVASGSVAASLRVRPSTLEILSPRRKQRAPGAPSHKLGHDKARARLHREAGGTFGDDLRVGLTFRHRVDQRQVELAVADIWRHELLAVNDFETRQHARDQVKERPAGHKVDVGEIKTPGRRHVTRYRDGTAEVDRRTRAKNDVGDRNKEERSRDERKHEQHARGPGDRAAPLRVSKTKGRLCCAHFSRRFPVALRERHRKCLAAFLHCRVRFGQARVERRKHVVRILVGTLAYVTRRSLGLLDDAVRSGLRLARSVRSQWPSLSTRRAGCAPRFPDLDCALATLAALRLDTLRRAASCAAFQ